MDARSSKVLVISDRSYGEKLAQVNIPGVAVWIVDSPINRSIAERLWREHPSHSHLSGITVFQGDSTLSTEEEFLSELDTIDLHHGSYSSNSPYTELEVIGVQLSTQLRSELKDYGFADYRVTAIGFRATRSR